MKRWHKVLIGCRMTNSDRIHPWWQNLRVGDEVEMCPSGEILQSHKLVSDAVVIEFVHDQCQINPLHPGMIASCLSETVSAIVSPQTKHLGRWL